MRDFNTLEFHPTAEKIVSILCQKTQNDNPKFFRILLSYYLAKVAASMRVKIMTQDRGEIPVNLYAINLASSGHGKGHSTNIIEEQVINQFRDVFFTDTYPLISEQSLVSLATQRAIVKGEDEEVMLDKVKKEFKELGKLAFSFDSGTPAAIKQMRHKLLMADIGAVNLEIDEIGSNLLGNGEALNTFLELFDVGKIKQKLTKNTKENVRSEEIDGRTPTNLLMFGTPSKLFDGSKVEDEFYSFLETGYARRCLFGYSRNAEKDRTVTPEEVFDALTDPSANQYIKDISTRLGRLASITNHGKVLTVSKAVSILVIEYRLHCEKIADDMGEHEEIAKAEVAHRYFKALKLAGIYAFIDGEDEITKDNFYHAIHMVEESGKAFEEILKRDRPYVKLAKYIGSVPNEVTHVELAEDLAFYRGSAATKHELLQLAAAWGYRNNIIIKRTVTNGIEFLKGEVLQKTDLENLHLAYSKDISDGYKNVQVDWEDIWKLTQEPYMHWINHHSTTGHRSEDKLYSGFDMVVLDIDGTVSINDVALMLKKYKFLAHTTKQHTEAAHRFRLILPMNYYIKLNPADYRAFMKNVFEWLPFELDSQTIDRCRKWSTCKGGHYYNEGEDLLDARLFIPKTSKNDEQKAFMVSYASMTNMERWFLMHSGPGSRNNQLLRYAMLMVDMGYPEDAIREKVYEMNAKFTDSLTQKEINNTIMVSVMKKLADVETV